MQGRFSVRRGFRVKYCCRSNVWFLKKCLCEWFLLLHLFIVDRFFRVCFFDVFTGLYFYMKGSVECMIRDDFSAIVLKIEFVNINRFLGSFFSIYIEKDENIIPNIRGNHAFDIFTKCFEIVIINLWNLSISKKNRISQNINYKSEI